MRWLPILALGLAACGFDQSGLAAGHVLRDDSAADFGATGSALDGAEITPDGLITPLAFTTGALLAKGANSELFTDPATIDWTTLDANTPARVALAAPLGDWGGGAPIGVGLTGADNFTIWLQGDIWLEAGMHTFTLGADDNGLLDLATGPGEPFTRVVTDEWFQGDQTGTFTAPADGWYPIRIAQSEGGGNAKYVLQHQPPGGTMAPLDPDRLRAPIGAERGLVADAFDDFYLMQPVGRSLTAGTMLAQDFGTAVPADTGITSALAYSFHWAAQFRIDVEGDYAFLLDTDDGQRLRIDGGLLIDKLVTTPVMSTTMPIHLAPGWHDVVIDYAQYAAAAHAHLQVASGPELAGSPFPLDRVRPLVPRTDRVGSGVDGSSITIPVGGTMAFSITPPIPAGASVDGVDVAYTVAAVHMRDLQISVIAPDGSRAIVRPAGDVDHGGTTMERRSTHDLDGKPAAGTWQIEIRDVAAQNGAGAKNGMLTVHYVGGRPPITETASYDSIVHDLGAPSHIDDLSYSAPAPQGSGVAVRVRTGATAAETMAQPWSDPVTSDAPPIVPDGEFVQYRVELSSDGDHSAAFDWIQLVYRSTN